MDYQNVTIRTTMSQSQNPSQNQSQAPSQTTSRNQTPGSLARARYTAAYALSTKAKWDDRSMEIFLRLCVTETTNGNRPGPHFNKIGWENLVSRFNSTACKSYTRKMLKNKWDVMKKDWGIWQKLVRNETGLGWDPLKGTVVASPDWWSRKLQVTPEAAKFRSRGPMLVHEQEILFSDCVANGGESWTPNSGVMPQHMVDEMVNGEINQEAVGEEGETGIEDDMLHDTEEETNTVSRETLTPAAPTEPICRRTRSYPPRSRLGKSKKTTTSQIVAKCLQSMANKFDNLTPQACPCKNKETEHTIDTCLSILDGLEDVEEGDELWMYATRLFLKPIVRELFVKMKTDRVRAMWLKNQMERDLSKRNFQSTSSPSSSTMETSINNQNY